MQSKISVILKLIRKLLKSKSHNNKLLEHKVEYLALKLVESYLNNHLNNHYYLKALLQAQVNMNIKQKLQAMLIQRQEDINNKIILVTEIKMIINLLKVNLQEYLLQAHPLLSNKENSQFSLNKSQG